MVTTVYIADQGDDRKDGLTPENAVYSIKAAIKIAIRVGATELDIQRTSLERLKKMASKKKTGCGWRIVTSQFRGKNVLLHHNGKTATMKGKAFNEFLSATKRLRRKRPHLRLVVSNPTHQPIKAAA